MRKNVQIKGGNMMTIALTGATGELGRLIIKELLKKELSDPIIAIVRNKEKAYQLFGEDIDIRFGDYQQPDSLKEAFSGIDKLLFISSPNTDDTARVVEHAQVVKAARDNGIKHIYYTSIAHADKSPLSLAKLHRATEAMIKVSNLPFTFLRNPLYSEVFINPSLKQSVESGKLISNTGTGRLNTVPRRDLAKATAHVLTQEGFENKTLELVSSTTWTFDSLAEALSQASGKTVTHQAVSYEEAVEQFVAAGLPEPIAHFSASMYQAISEGAIEETETELVHLIGEETDLTQLVTESIK
jgi:NAD(P)H dehydrogenase (quinone)